MSCALPRLAAVMLTVVSLGHVAATPAAGEELAVSATFLTLAPRDTPSVPAPLFPTTLRSAALSAAAAPLAPDFSRIHRPSVLPALYALTAVTQLLDAHSTRTALGNGAREANPVMQGVAGNSGALLAVKMGAAVGTVFFAENVWRRNRAGAIAMLVAVNVATAAIAAHNYSVAARLR
jgi:hypothetical protein